MAIWVDEDLTAAPNPITLPKRVEFRQTLHSTLAAEDISVAYSLSPGHDVWFEDSDDKLQKVIVRQETVGQAPQVCVDRLTMVLGPGGQAPPLTVEVTQAIRDSLGNVTPSLCVIQLQT